MRRFFIRIFTPFARYLAGVHPTTLTIIALITGIFSGIAYRLTVKDPAFYIVGGLFAVFSGVSDSLDGIVARLYGRCSKLGDFLDHFCDRVVDIAILTGLAFSAHAGSTLGLLVLIIILLNNYQGTQIQASFGERIYKGGGKAELFTGLVIFSVFMTFFPESSIRFAGKHIAPINCIFIMLGIASLLNIFYRFHLTYKRYTEST